MSVPIKTMIVQDELPKSLLGTGLGIMFLAVGLLIAVAWLLEYSDKIVGQIVITTPILPAELLAKTNGELELLVQNQQTVTAEMPIAIFNDGTDYTRLQQIKKDITTETSVREIAAHLNATVEDKETTVGAIRNELLALDEAYRQLQRFEATNRYPKLIAIKQDRIALYQEELQLLAQKSDLIAQDIQLAEKDAKRNQRLNDQAIIATREYEGTLEKQLSKSFSELDNQSDINAIQGYIKQLKQEIVELQQRQQTEQNKYQIALQTSLQQLRAAIQQWENQHLLKASIAGTCNFSNTLRSNSYITTGQKIGTIVPSDSSAFIGLVRIPTRGTGKLQLGQVVNVHLDYLSSTEFGILKGEVEQIALLPESSFLEITVQFPTNLTSSYNIPFEFQQLMSGRAEIIVDKRSFIERIWNQFKAQRLNQ